MDKRRLIFGVVDTGEMDMAENVNWCQVEFKNAAELGGFCLVMSAAGTKTPANVDQLIDKINDTPGMLEKIRKSVDSTKTCLKKQIGTVVTVFK